MPEKTSEDLVFDKLKFPSVRELFAEQIRDNSQKISKKLWYIERYPNNDCRVETIPYENLDTAFRDYEYVNMSGSMPTFKKIKKD